MMCQASSQLVVFKKLNLSVQRDLGSRSPGFVVLLPCHGHLRVIIGELDSCFELGVQYSRNCSCSGISRASSPLSSGNIGSQRVVAISRDGSRAALCSGCSSSATDAMLFAGWVGSCDSTS
eukprot:589216-Rhodomonas_salina.2